MILMWKLPDGIDIDFVKGLMSLSGKSKLNPQIDINGSWFISDEEYNSPYFDNLKDQYSEIVDQMEYTEFEPLIIDRNYE